MRAKRVKSIRRQVKSLAYFGFINYLDGAETSYDVVVHKIYPLMRHRYQVVMKDCERRLIKRLKKQYMVAKTKPLKKRLT